GIDRRRADRRPAPLDARGHDRGGVRVLDALEVVDRVGGCPALLVRCAEARHPLGEEAMQLLVRRRDPVTFWLFAAWLGTRPRRPLRRAARADRLRALLAHSIRRADYLLRCLVHVA